VFKRSRAWPKPCLITYFQRRFPICTCLVNLEVLR